MVQGSVKHKSKAQNIGLKSRSLKASNSATSKRKNAPAKQKRRLRDVNVTKKLHKNIESLIAAKVVRNEGKLRINEIQQLGAEQLKVTQGAKKTKGKAKSKEETMQRQLQKASKRLEKQ